MAQISRKVTDGPSKFDLMMALFDSSEQHPRETVFVLEEKSTRVKILSVAQESSSGESWNVEGYVKYPDSRWINFKGYFSTKNRKGVFNLDA